MRTPRKPGDYLPSPRGSKPSSLVVDMGVPSPYELDSRERLPFCCSLYTLILCRRRQCGRELLAQCCDELRAEPTPEVFTGSAPQVLTALALSPEINPFLRKTLPKG